MSKNDQRPLHVAGRSYIQKLIEARKIENAKGTSSATYSKDIINELEFWLNKCSYNTDEMMSSFLYRYAEKIMYLLPFTDEKSHEKLSREFYALYAESHKLLNYEAIC